MPKLRRNRLNCCSGQDLQLSWLYAALFVEQVNKAAPGKSSILAWGIPWIEEHGGLQSMGMQRVRHDQATFTSLHLLNIGHPALWV